MQDSALPCSKIERRRKRPLARQVPTGAPLVRNSVPTADLERLVNAWLTAGEIAQHSPRTLQNRRGYLRRFRWFLEREGIVTCDTDAIRRFLLFVSQPKTGENAWPDYDRDKPITPGTVAAYHRHLRALFNWLIAEEVIDQSPLRRIDTPIDRPDQVDPLTPDEVDRLLAAAERASYAARDTAILYLLLDTGLRASELLSLRTHQIDILARRARVEGKGGKERSFYFSNRTARKLLAYIQTEARPQPEPLFAGERGALTRSGLQQLITRIAARAGVPNVHPHRFRHTFAIEYLRSGGERGTLQELLGQTDYRMVQRYVKYAQADIESGHRRHSPIERHFRVKRGGTE